jgi:hypothetical protein
MSTSADELRQNLAAKIAESQPTAVDARNFKRTMIITVRKGGEFNPDDRLEATDVIVALNDGRFVNWDTVATNYSTVNAGTVQLTTAVSTEADVSVGAPSVAPIAGTLSGKASQSSSRQETLPETFQVENLTVSLEEGGTALRVRRQGGPGVDLAGNTVVKLEIALDGQDRIVTYAVKSYSDKLHHPLPASQISIVRKDTQVASDKAVTAKVSLTYVVRHVKTGGGTGINRDQDVLEHTIHAPDQTYEVIPARDIVPDTYGLFFTTKRGPVEIEQPGLAPRWLCFASPEAAEEFLQHLRLWTTPGNVGGAVIGAYDGATDHVVPLSVADASTLEVQSDCSHATH